ncbi:MAG TPA: serine/threonine protein kinase [Chloroflexi bacterium]|nr:serine/threonine protein kinase [Chloroflexota bacterium]
MWDLRFLSESYLFRKAGARSYARGMRYADEGRVQIIDITTDAARFLVQGSRPRPYRVFLEVFGDDLLYDCTCPVGQEKKFCKHCVAAAVTLRRTLQKQDSGEGEFRLPWKREIRKMLGLPALSPIQARGTFYLLVFVLSRRYYYDADFVLEPYWLSESTLKRVLPRKDWPQTPAAWAEWLEAHAGWAKDHFQRRLPASRYGIHALNAPPGAVALAFALGRRGHYGGAEVPLGEALEAIVEWNIPVYFASPRRGRALKIAREGAHLVLALEAVDGGLQLSAHMRIGNRVLEAHDVHEVSSRPPWLLVDETWLVRADLKGLTAWLEALRNPLFIPQQEVEDFRDRYLPRLLAKLGRPLEGGVVTYEPVRAEPVPRLYLQEVDETLGAELRFAYGEHEVLYEVPVPEVTTLEDPHDPWKFYRVQRDPEAERRWHHEAVQAKYGLKRGTGDEPALLLLRARTSPVDFLLDKVPALAAAGFEIYGEENIKKVRVSRHQPTLSVNITSGIDWFNVQAVVQFGEQTVSLAEIKRALRKKRRYVKLADGSIGRLPEAWLERYKRLFGLAAETDETTNTLRFADFHALMLEELAEEAEQAEIDAEFRQRLEQLKDFEGIAEHPLPKGLRGALRPYQLAGYNWLHFLHDYGFGGILADDMGLGKTVQVLAFLLSLRESGHAQAPDLVVVPRSLLINWQREVEKFTPGLKVLAYFGPQRPPVETFADYDLVLTTYGVMRVDNEKLRGYRFHYIVLDESQAIKNPLAKTSRAARRLQSEHRLAMTGTPVENNTFELWAQFAFVMPGLLGGLDYFKEQFVRPIEKSKDEQTAQTLRRMVYPFILRRTKEQVAPELPPRTERVIYCPMEPAQRRFYLKLRDYYRELLIGLIEEEGLDKSRMKILEGLLRLRQASNHPKLIDPGFRGESGKMNVLLDTLETLHSEGHKALVFSQFVQMLRLVREALDERGIPYAYLDGSTRNRQEQVDRFQNDPQVPFFLISLKAGGVGLNLTAADYVIHVDPWWNPAVERQASDRTHRIGQDKPVFIFKLITRESVEEKILQLQEQKKELVEKLIATESSFLKELSPEDVQALFG